MSLSETVATVQGLMVQLAEELGKMLPEENPSLRKRVRALMEDAPKDMADLPTWFAGLTPEQLQNCWVQVIIDTMTHDEDWKLRDLSIALLSVREHPDVPVFILQERKAKPEPTPRQGFSKFELGLLAELEQHYQGGVLFLSDAFPNKNRRAKLAEVIERSEEWELVRPKEKQRGGRPRFGVKRR